MSGAEQANWYGTFHEQDCIFVSRPGVSDGRNG
jgi:hypothetical protein